MKKGLILRIITDLALVVSIFVLPWWLSLFFALACLFIFNNYFEVLVAGYILDILYGTNLYRTNMMFTFIATLALAASFFAKRNLSMYSQ